MAKLKLSDFGGLLDYAQAGDAQPWYKPVTVTWSEPMRIRADDGVPLAEDAYLKPGYLYILLKDHGNQKIRDQILYIGITNNLKRRFANHPKFWQIVKDYDRRVYFSVGDPNFHKKLTSNKRYNRQAIEELEHIYIWVLSEYLRNYQKIQSVPGMSGKGSRSWYIKNDGYDFSGNMPRRIIYPWAATES